MLVDHAFPPQQVGDVQHAEAGGNVHGLLAIERTRRLEAGLADRKGDAARDGEQDQQREDRIADDHQGMARAPRAADRYTHLLWLQRGTRRARRNAFLINERRADSVLPPEEGWGRLARIHRRARRAKAHWPRAELVRQRCF